MAIGWSEEAEQLAWSLITQDLSGVHSERCGYPHTALSKEEHKLSIPRNFMPTDHSIDLWE